MNIYLWVGIICIVSILILIGVEYYLKINKLLVGIAIIILVIIGIGAFASGCYQETKQDVNILPTYEEVEEELKENEWLQNPRVYDSIEYIWKDDNSKGSIILFYVYDNDYFYTVVYSYNGYKWELKSIYTPQHEA